MKIDTSTIPNVYSMRSNSGNDVPNQMIMENVRIKAGGKWLTGKAFKSYQTIIAFREYGCDGVTLLDANRWDYSTTTSRYRNDFLNLDTKETKQAIKEGTIKLVNLN